MQDLGQVLVLVAAYFPQSTPLHLAKSRRPLKFSSYTRSVAPSGAPCPYPTACWQKPGKSHVGRVTRAGVLGRRDVLVSIWRGSGVTPTRSRGSGFLGRVLAVVRLDLLDGSSLPPPCV